MNTDAGLYLLFSYATVAGNQPQTVTKYWVCLQSTKTFFP